MRIKVKSNPIFKEVDQSRKRYVVMKGSAGSGKSVDTAQNYVVRLMMDKGRNLLCIRKSEVTNRDSTFSELVSAINNMGVSGMWTVTMSPLMLRCKNGNSVIFRGVNDTKQREKLKSITFPKGKLTDVWIEEATELTQEDFEIIDDRLRGELPDGQFYQIRMTFNPVSSSHWIKRAFFDTVDSDVLTHHSTYLDNRFVDEAYKRRMERRKKLDPDGYRIYGLGDWGEIGGLILPSYTVAELSKRFDDYSDVAIGQDFGFNHANAILILGNKDDVVHILGEIYVFEKDTSEIIEIANERKIPKNKRMWCDSAEPDRIKMWRAAGYYAKGVNKGGSTGSVKAQIDWLKQHELVVDPSCINTIKELSQWKWKKDDTTGLYKDEPVAFQDDAMAALRYGIESWRKNSSWLT